MHWICTKWHRAQNGWKNKEPQNFSALPIKPLPARALNFILYSTGEKNSPLLSLVHKMTRTEWVSALPSGQHRVIINAQGSHLCDGNQAG